MQSSGSLKKKSDLKVAEARRVQSQQPWWLIALVWLARLSVGAVFIVSGVSKAIDPWGLQIKMTEYLTFWGWDIPRSVVTAGAMSLSIWESLLGFMLALGCYRRSAVWGMIATMAVMLPLTLYIYIYNPVNDCGCFGDYIILSNSATFWKNVAIVAVLVFLALKNRKVMSLISPYVQWIASLAVGIYVFIIALIGYNVQPLIDFRSYPVGAMLAPDPEAEDTSEVEFEFIYEKEGEQQTFTADNLPDSSWSFIDRRIISGQQNSADNFTVYDNGEDVTAEAIIAEGEQLLILIPDMQYADISMTFYINALNRYLNERGGLVTGIIGGDEQDIEQWRDISMAQYDLYTAEPSQIRELARGNIAIVFLRDGRIVWKKTSRSLNGKEMMETLQTDTLDSFAVDRPSLFRFLTWCLAITLFFIIFANSLGRLALRLTRKAKSGAPANEACNGMQEREDSPDK